MSVARIRQAVILAGGTGTRLGELTDEVPKPLLPVAGRPFLDWLIGNLERQGVQSVILTTGYRAEAFDAWRESTTLAPSLSVHVEDEPLGTGGALPLLADRLDAEFYVLNGDTIFDAPLQELSAALEPPAMSAAIALRHVDDTARYGSVRLDGDRVLGFLEKGATGPGLINGGVYALRRRALARVATPSALETGLLPELAAEGELSGVPSDGFFIDIGIPDTFAEAQRSIPKWWWSLEHS